MPSPTFDPDVPFLGAEALAAGISPGQLRGPTFRQLVRGVYISATVRVTPSIQARGALLVAPPRAAVSRHTAALLWGGIVPDHWRIHVTTFWPKAHVRSLRRPGQAGSGGGQHEWGRMTVDGIDARVSSDPSHVVVRKGIRMTSPVRTFLDLAEDLDLVDMVVLGDSLVKATDISPADLVAAAASPGRYRRRARVAAALVRSGVDSPQESRLRMLVVLAGLPEPEVNLLFRDADGVVVRRLDMGYRRARVGLEYDGRQHAEDDNQWAGDIVRREEFEEAGWRIVTVISTGLWRDPARTLQRLASALGRRGIRVRITSSEWTRYFGRRGHRSA